MEEENSTENYNKIYLASILALIVGLGIMTYLWTSTKSNLAECENTTQNYKDTIQGMNKMLSAYVGDMSNDLKADFRNMLDTYDKLIVKDASQTDSLNIQKDKIQSQIEKIEKLQRSRNFTASQISKLKEENETLRVIMRGYVYEIDSLNTLNLQKDLIITEQIETIDQRTTERDQYKDAAETSAEKVKIGSKLTAYGFSSGALRSFDKNKSTSRARQAVQLQSSFTISGNLIANAGNKTVFMQIIGPNEKTLQNVSSFKTETLGGTISFSEKKQIDYQNKSIDLTIYFDIRNGKLSKGNYKVNIYCDQNLIGSDSFSLK